MVTNMIRVENLTIHHFDWETELKGEIKLAGNDSKLEIKLTHEQARKILDIVLDACLEHITGKLDSVRAQYFLHKQEALPAPVTTEVEVEAIDYSKVTEVADDPDKEI